MRRSAFSETKSELISPCRKRGEAKGDRQKSDQKRQKKWQNGYQKVTETEKSDLPPFAYPLLRHADDFREGDEDSNFSLFRVRRFTESPEPLHWIAFSVEILTKPPIHWIASPQFTENPFFSLKSASSHPLPKNRFWKKGFFSEKGAVIQWMRLLVRCFFWQERQFSEEVRAIQGTAKVWKLKRCCPHPLPDNQLLLLGHVSRLVVHGNWRYHCCDWPLECDCLQRAAWVAMPLWLPLFGWFCPDFFFWGGGIARYLPISEKHTAINYSYTFSAICCLARARH